MANTTIKLPQPAIDGNLSVEAALKNRRSIREYQNKALTLKELSQLLWSAQGITGSSSHYRTTPSAGATNPLKLYLIAGEITGLDAGIYHYDPMNNSLSLEKKGDYRIQLAQAALNQSFIADAPAAIIFTAVFNRTTAKYGQRGIRYVYMEVGHAAQNIYLQSVPLGLGTVVVGAFEDDKIKQILEQPDKEPLYIMPMGWV